MSELYGARERGLEERRFAAEMTEQLMEGELENMFDLDGECADGCIVEPDGQCHHGYRSWMVVAGLI